MVSNKRSPEHNNDSVEKRSNSENWVTNVVCESKVSLSQQNLIKT
jgi:hypothetical protein